MTIEFYKIWIDQCRAAEGIQEEYGTEKALGYLIGEKLLNFIEASDTHPEFAAELPAFVAEIQRIFEPHDITAYFQNVRRVGALGHVMTDERYETFRQADGEDDAVHGARNILLLERAKELLL